MAGRRFRIGLIKPEKSVALSPAYSSNVTNHGRFQLFADLLEDEPDTSMLVLAACRDGDLVKLSPDLQKSRTITISTKAFASPIDRTRAEQLKITIDETFVRRVVDRSSGSKLNFESLDLSDVQCGFFSIDEINERKLKSLEIKLPGRLINFLQDYERDKSKNEEEGLSRLSRKELLEATRETRGRKKLQPRKEAESNFGVSLKPKSYYDLNGRRHVVEKEGKKKKRRNLKEQNQWWVRLSEPRIREIGKYYKEQVEIEQEIDQTANEENLPDENKNEFDL